MHVPSSFLLTQYANIRRRRRKSKTTVFIYRFLFLFFSFRRDFLFRLQSEWQKANTSTQPQDEEKDQSQEVRHANELQDRIPRSSEAAVPPNDITRRGASGRHARRRRDFNKLEDREIAQCS